MMLPQNIVLSGYIGTLETVSGQSKTERELRLEAFIDWSLKASRSDKYSPTFRQQLHDRALESRQILQQLRNLTQIRPTPECN